MREMKWRWGSGNDILDAEGEDAESEASWVRTLNIEVLIEKK